MRFIFKVCLFTVLMALALAMLPANSLDERWPVQEPAPHTVATVTPGKTLSQSLYELRGRGAGTPWEKEAADILAAYFQEIGLQALPAYPSYLQEFPLGTVTSFYNAEGRLRFRSGGPLTQVSQNVIGYLPGQDPEGKWIIFGAHYDGQGETDGIVYPSANDNLSGVMALAALAKALAAEPALNDTLVFVAFGAEEPGLRGSYYLASDLPVPKEKIQAVINLDTIGKTCETLVIYTTEHNALTALLASVLRGYGFQSSVVIATGVSDHYPFSLQGIPSVTIATANWKEGNHSPEDTLDKVDLYQVGSIAGALKQALHYLAR